MQMVKVRLKREKEVKPMDLPSLGDISFLFNFVAYYVKSCSPMQRKLELKKFSLTSLLRELSSQPL